MILLSLDKILIGELLMRTWVTNHVAFFSGWDRGLLSLYVLYTYINTRSVDL